MKRLSTSTIGLFIVGAVIVFVGSIILFSSGLHFGKSHTFVLYFNESVNGLDIGAPVKLRGVRIGQVCHIAIQYDGNRRRVRVPVTIRLEDSYFRMARRKNYGNPTAKVQSDGQHALEKVDGVYSSGTSPIFGLVGSLQTESFVTGKLYIDLDYEALDAKHYPALDENGIPEIPTKPSDLQNMSERMMTIIEGLSGIDYAAIGQSLNGICTQLSNIPIADIGRALNDAVPRALDAFCGTISRLGDAAENVFERADGSVSNFSNACDEFAKTLRRCQSLLGEDSSLSMSVEHFFQNVSAAASAIRFFLEFLERNPNAIFTGKRGELNQ
ncbi:MAG: MlaD family protein [Puniceicoccales bacterium]|jgi:paraquat-inducible protein B|nr:MlaD family protein [Puniceicoccales bacterium]